MPATGTVDSDRPWDHLTASALLRPALIWGAAFGLFEAAYFTRANEIFPFGFGHVILALVLAAEYALVALVAPTAVRITKRLWGGIAAPMTLLAGPWFLLLLLAVSDYRDRRLLHARTKEDLLLTAALIAGFAAAWLALAWLLRRRSPTAVHRVLNGLGVVGILVGVVWLATSRSAWPEVDNSGAVTAEEAGEVDETGLRVLIIGMDGGEWRVMDPLMEEGKLPTYAALAARGRTANIETIEPTFSPIIWTSIASGKGYEKHRILSHVYSQPPFGLPAIPHDPKRIKMFTKVMKLNVRGGHKLGLFPLGVYSSANLRARRVWDIVGEFGMPTVTLGWYITHPVMPVRGVQISDRIHLMAGATDEELTAAIWPDSLIDVVEPLILSPEELPRDRLDAFLDVADLGTDGRARLRREFPEWFRTIGGEMARDLTTRSLVPEVFPRVPDWRLGAVYYRAMDGSHHVTWRYRELPANELDDNPERRFRDVVDDYYVFCDGLLRDTLQLADENTVVFVLSDHGWENQLYGHKRKPDGFFMAAGGPIVPSAERGRASIMDIAPTSLALLGLPVPEDMDGRVLEEWIDPAFLKDHPIRTVPSYEHPGALTSALDEGAVDERILEQLQGLGYLGN